MGKIQIISIISSILFILIILELVRKKKIQEQYSILWFLAGIILLILSIFKELLNIIANLIGIFYPPAVLILIIIFIGAILFLHFSIVISKLTEDNKNLAQAVGLLEERIRRLESKTNEK